MAVRTHAVGQLTCVLVLVQTRIKREYMHRLSAGNNRVNRTEVLVNVLKTHVHKRFWYLKWVCIRERQRELVRAHVEMTLIGLQRKAEKRVREYLSVWRRKEVSVVFENKKGILADKELKAFQISKLKGAIFVKDWELEAKYISACEK